MPGNVALLVGFTAKLIALSVGKFSLIAISCSRMFRYIFKGNFNDASSRVNDEVFSPVF